MEAVIDIISRIYAALAVMPFASFFVIWFAVFMLSRDKKISTGAAMDLTFILLLGSISILMERVFGSRFGFWLLVLLLLIAAGWIGREQNRLKGRINLPRLLKVVSRGGFLVLSAVYLILLIIGICQYVTMS